MKEVAIVGMGMGNPDLLTIGALRAIQEADLIIGSKRLLCDLPEGKLDRVCFVATRSDMICTQLQQPSWEKACIVMSGDIGIFSGADGLRDRLKEYCVRVFPGISAVQYFAAKINRSWQHWRLLSTHGKQCDIAAEVRAGGELFFFTGGEYSVASLCKILREAGWGALKITVGEQLSYSDERIVSATATELAEMEFDGLSVMLIEERTSETKWPWSNAGIPDECFIRGKTPMTKQEVRVAALAKMKVASDDVLYDIGAGTGSVAIEMARLADKGRVFAVERNAEAVALIEQNSQRFGVRNLHLIAGIAPRSLETLPTPQAAFIGGSGGNLSGILEALHRKNPHYRVCIACIALETLTEATRILRGTQYRHVEISQISVSRAESVGAYSMMKAQNPVFLVSAEGVDA